MSISKKLGAILNSKNDKLIKIRYFDFTSCNNVYFPQPHFVIDWTNSDTPIATGWWQKIMQTMQASRKPLFILRIAPIVKHIQKHHGLGDEE